jgi:hypothetical protein|eukprot:31378-Pelagococcus_subviridis.AAC.14
MRWQHGDARDPKETRFFLGHSERHGVLSRGTMSVSRSSRSALGLFRRLAVTPGAPARVSSPAAWAMVRPARGRRDDASHLFA